MEEYWSYSYRSAPSLDKLKTIVNERLNTNTEDNKWTVLNNLFITKNISESRQNPNIESVDLTIEDKDSVVIEDVSFEEKPKSFESETVIQNQQENIAEIAQQILEDFKTENNFNADILENMFNTVSLLDKVFEDVVCNVPAITVRNVCKAFFKMNKKVIEARSKEFFEFFLLPCVLSHEPSREIESSVFDCLDNTDHIAVCSFVIVPVMLRSQASHFLNVNFINKLSAQQREYILKEYLYRNTEYCTWILPIILLLYKSVNYEMSYTFIDLIVKFLCNGANVHRKDLNFSKILHAVVLNLSKRDVAKCDEDFWNALRQVALENETAFKTPCLSIILKQMQSD